MAVYVEGEQESDICQESHAMMDKLERYQEAHIQEGQEGPEQDQNIDRGFLWIGEALFLWTGEVCFYGQEKHHDVCEERNAMMETSEKGSGSLH